MRKKQLVARSNPVSVHHVVVQVEDEENVVAARSQAADCVMVVDEVAAEAGEAGEGEDCEDEL